ncbi:sigma-70 family RNA polymerase sigma factor [Singulisphaera sp. PoT]|uniref:sigma-70 family RNA polymerase sigma factor n=1 Tax=Singulisphaera sp. PoT TaxID=3411797 RepID=UPI003BF595E5
MGKISGAGELVLEDLRTLYTLGNAGGRTDGQLVSAFLAGDTHASEEAFGVLVGRHGSMVMGVCRRILMDRHAAEDAFQATFLVLARRARSIRRSESIGGWLHRVARRIAVRAGKRAGRNRPTQQDLVIHAESLVAEQPSPGEAVDRAELRSLLDGEIDRLDPAQRQIVVLCDLEELTYEQAAERLHWPVGTVKSRLSRGRIQLRERLIRRGLAPALVAGTGAVCGGDALASLSAPLVQQVIRTAMITLSGSPSVPAAVSSLAVEELKSSAVSRLLKWTVAALLMGGGSVAAWIVATGSDRPRDMTKSPSPVQVALAQDPKPDDVPTLKLSARGQVVDAQGRPVSNARVYIREWAINRTGGANKAQHEEMMRTGMLPDILAQAKTDAEGRFQLEDVNATGFPGREDNRVLGKSWFPWDLVVLAEGHGVAWARLTPQNQREPLKISLPAEATLRGKIQGTDGKPIPGAKLRVVDVAALNDDVRGDLQTTNDRLSLHWSSVPLEAVADQDGWFVLRNLLADRRISLFALSDGFQQQSIYAATTPGAQPDLEDRTFHFSREVKTRHPVQTGELSVILTKLDHQLSGRLAFEGTDEPAAGTMVWFHQMKQIKTDRDGRFLFKDLPAGTVEIHAWASDKEWAPLDVMVEIPKDPKILERTFRLPRGIAASGQVVDSRGAGIAAVTLRYETTPEGEGLPTQFLIEATTDAKGVFQLHVPAGPGKIVISKVPDGFTGPGGRFVGAKPDDQFSLSVAGPSGTTLDNLTIALEQAGRVTIQAIDANDQPLGEVEARRYGIGLPDKTPQTTDAKGFVEIVGLEQEGAYTIDLIHAGKSIGARVEVSAKDALEAKGPVRVKLSALGVLEGRVLDEAGKPLLGPVLWLRTNAKSPRMIGAPVEGKNEVKEDGSFRFDGLIPGGSYYVDVQVAGHAGQNSKYVVVKSGASETLEPFRLPITNRNLRGIVVDPRGQPVANATVSYDQRRGNYYTNASGRWFMNTDASGHFELTGLPLRGLAVMAYRSPTGPDRSIRNLIRQDVADDQAEVRVVLPDARRKLQGIED